MSIDSRINSEVGEYSVATSELSCTDSDMHSDQSTPPQDSQQRPEYMMRTPSPKHSSQLQIPMHYSSSPPKAYGSKINVNGDFGTVARGNGVVLDKSLLCKALFDAGRTAICVCLPRRFGKTFNLSVLEEFFNILHGKDATVVNGVVDNETARCNRLKLFGGSLLLENYREFFDENFCKFPVIRISMKDNEDLRAGVLVGVHYVELSDLYSGANNIDVLPLTIMEERRQDTRQTDGTGLDYFGELFAFTRPEVEVLVNKVHQQYPAIHQHSTTAIIEKAVEWYDGYCFGICGGKFNPHAVLMFLQKLCATSLDNAACNFWEKTGNQRTVENIVLNNRANIVALATELLRGYQANHSGFVKLAGVWEQPSNWSSKWPVIRVSLDQQYMVDATGTASIDKLVTLFIYTGYLTIKPGGHIVVPNGEMRRMWERLLLLSSDGECGTQQQEGQWASLHSELYAGNIKGLLGGIREVMDLMPNSANEYHECVYGDIFRTFLFMKLRRRDDAGSEQYVRFLSELETGMGKTDLIITFPATQQHPDQLVVIIEFKRIYKDEFKSPDYPLKRARDGLEQIIDKKYAKTQRGSGRHPKRRLDIGISMGCGEVAMRQRLWKSLTDRLRATDRSISSDFYPQKKANETNEEWDQRLIEADQTAWQDGLGWETVALDTSFYCDW
ncbi:hypothetical protein IWW36_002539 [Coemansia brasiliensis]|uniref:AAA-ATPase-like domain-containing protein n=1 Tax=Coemansia brasiliensis TaxID=2650707 RepID=A0A9W8I6V7_9FUNG|nr:hypothetical protein IWW36_002539 [Coemansia brasiliensis]